MVVGAAGGAKLLEEAVGLVSPAGSVVSLNFAFTQIPIRYMQMIRKEANLVGSRMQNGKFPIVLNDYPDRLAAIEPVLVTHVFSADDAAAAFDLALSGDDTVGKIVIDF